MKEVYQLSDLASRSALDEGADKPAKLAVIGYPVAHSASPVMHQAALDALGIDARYIRLEVKPGEVDEALTKMRELGFIGFNVTVPHKFEIMESCDIITDDAKALGAVNTILFNYENNQVIGHNTDAPGLVKAIKGDFGANLAEHPVMIVGVGGGAGRAVATQCARMGCPNLFLVNRTLEKAQDLAASLDSSSITCATPDDSAISSYIGETKILINATSLGLKETDPTPIYTSSVTTQHMVYDMIYKPAETQFLKQSQANGAQTANGLSMLLHQGVLAFQYWFPNTQPLEMMRKGLVSTL